MSYINVKMTHVKIDWDDLNVGDRDLDHSENFFEYKHSGHERLEDMDLLQEEFAKTELTNIEDQCVHYKIEKLDSTLCVVAEDDHHENKENVNLPDNNNDSTTKTNNVNIKQEHITSPGQKDEAVNHLDVTAKPTKILKPNLAYQWSTQKVVVSKTALPTKSKGAVSKHMPPPPNAYLVKDLYQKKREEAEKRRIEEERKKREFHSRPVPNFNAHHQKIDKRKHPHGVTVAVTPQVLRNSKEADEKRRKRLEEWKQKSQAPKFESRAANVLREKPFVPEKKPLVIQQCPFNLHTEKRLVERKHYDVEKHKALEEKRKQEEEERKKREEERIRELRKAATFKARPNPFKN